MLISIKEIESPCDVMNIMHTAQIFMQSSVYDIMMTYCKSPMRTRIADMNDETIISSIFTLKCVYWESYNLFGIVWNDDIIQKTQFYKRITESFDCTLSLDIEPDNKTISELSMNMDYTKHLLVHVHNMTTKELQTIMIENSYNLWIDEIESDINSARKLVAALLMYDNLDICRLFKGEETYGTMQFALNILHSTQLRHKARKLRKKLIRKTQ